MTKLLNIGDTFKLKFTVTKSLWPGSDDPGDIRAVAKDNWGANRFLESALVHATDIIRAPVELKIGQVWKRLLGVGAESYILYVDDEGVLWEWISNPNSHEGVTIGNRMYSKIDNFNTGWEYQRG